MMLRRLDDLVVEQAVEVFSSEVSNYYKANGSWTAAREAVTFFEFDARTQASFPGPPSRLESEGYPPRPPSAPAGNVPGRRAGGSLSVEPRHLSLWSTRPVSCCSIWPDSGLET